MKNYTVTKSSAKRWMVTMDNGGCYSTDSDDLGLGTQETRIIMFSSEEVANMYINYEKQLDYYHTLTRDQERELNYLKTIKGANENLRKVRAEKKRKI